MAKEVQKSNKKQTEPMGLSQLLLLGLKKSKKVEKVKTNENLTSLKIFERVKNLLEKQGKNVDWLSSQLSIKSRSTLYVAFKKGSVSIEMLNKIASVLEVESFYFFENDIIDRLTEEVAKHPQNPDLKSFLMGFSRDVSKGLEVEKAVRKNLDPSGYLNSLLM